MKISIIEILLIASGINSFFLLLFVVKLKFNIMKSKVLLIMLLLIYSTGIFLHLISNMNPQNNLLISYLIMILFTMLSPILYLFVCALSKTKISKQIIIHFIPFAFLFFFLIFFRPIEDYVLIQKVYEFLIYLVIISQFFLYSFLIFKKVKSNILYPYDVKFRYQKKSITWLFILIFSYFFAIIFGAVTNIFEIFFEKENLWDYFWLYISVVLYLIAYNSLNFNNEIITAGPNGFAKYSKNNICSKLLEEYEMRLNDAISKKIFLNSKLSLSILSKNTGIPLNHLSQIINRKGKNFAEYINSYRIEYSKILLVENISNTITEIAYKSGFNSISAFNSAFKKLCGTSPTTWKKNIIN